jgi:hypothetical protein
VITHSKHPRVFNFYSRTKKYTSANFRTEGTQQQATRRGQWKQAGPDDRRADKKPKHPDYPRLATSIIAQVEGSEVNGQRGFVDV